LAIAWSLWARQCLKQGDDMNIYELADINQNEAKDLELKIMNSLNLKDFTNK